MVEGILLLYLFTTHRFVSGTVMMLVSSFVYLRLRLWPIAIAMGYVETSFFFFFPLAMGLFRTCSAVLLCHCGQCSTRW